MPLVPIIGSPTSVATVVVMSVPQLPTSQSPQDCQQVSEGLLSVV